MQYKNNILNIRFRKKYHMRYWTKEFSFWIILNSPLSNDEVKFLMQLAETFFAVQIVFHL